MKKPTAVASRGFLRKMCSSTKRPGCRGHYRDYEGYQQIFAAVHWTGIQAKPSRDGQAGV
jgi:hypothetical protein